MQKDILLNADGKNFKAYFSASDNAERHPGLILVQEIWGMTPHIKDVANRFAKEGFNVVAPDLLGGTGVLEKFTPQILKDAADPEKRHEAQAKMREAMQPLSAPEFAEDVYAKFASSFEYLNSLKNSNGNVGILGFCFGGTWSFFFATKEPRLGATVAFYGQPPKTEDIPEIESPVLAFYGEKDERLMESLPALKDAMLEEGKDFSSKVYPNTGHAFFNDTNPQAYNKEAAEDAWKLSLEFLKENLES